MKSCIDFYDDTAKSWAEKWYENETTLPYLKELLKCVKKDNPRILDLCCGAGYDSMRLHRLGADVVGVDLSEKSLEIAKNKNPNISFYKKDMLLSYADLGKFDGITCIAGIIHIENKYMPKVFKNMAEVLVSKGYLLLVYREGGENKQTTELNGEIYARNSIFHTKDELIKLGKKYFEFVKDLTPKNDTSRWKYCIFQKC